MVYIYSSYIYPSSIKGAEKSTGLFTFTCVTFTIPSISGLVLKIGVDTLA